MALEQEGKHRINASDLIGMIGIVIGAAGTGIAIWEARKNRSLREYLKVETMGDYHRATIVLGCAQLCLNSLQNGDVKTAIQEAGKTQGAAQTVFSKSIENIQHHHRYSYEDVDAWIKNNKIQENHKPDFCKYVQS
jgi:hypothetical protein